jgi:hypothetical protein
LGVVSVCTHAATNGIFVLHSSPYTHVDLTQSSNLPVLATSSMDSHIRLFDLEAEKLKTTINAGPGV